MEASAADDIGQEERARRARFITSYLARSRGDALRIARAYTLNDEDAEDVVQLACKAFMTRPIGYDEQFAVSTWMRNVIQGVALNYIESRDRKAHRTEGFKPDEYEWRFGTESDALPNSVMSNMAGSQGALRGRVLESMLALDREDAHLLCLVYVDDVARHEIARYLGISMKELADRLATARARFAAHYLEMEHERIVCDREAG